MTETNTVGPLVWDEISEKIYEVGTSQGALYVMGTDGNYQPGVAWNGLISVKQAPAGAEPKTQYANNRKYINMRSAENFKFSIEAFTYPDEFKACDGSKKLADGLHVGQQKRATFGLAYATVVGNDTEGIDYGEKIHIIYGATVAPASRDYTTINEDPEAITFTWEGDTTPPGLSTEMQALGIRPTAYAEIDLTEVAPAAATALKEKLYGSAKAAAQLPTLDELVTLLSE